MIRLFFPKTNRSVLMNIFKAKKKRQKQHRTKRRSLFVREKENSSSALRQKVAAFLSVKCAADLESNIVSSFSFSMSTCFHRYSTCFFVRVDLVSIDEDKDARRRSMITQEGNVSIRETMDRIRKWKFSNVDRNSLISIIEWRRGKRAAWVFRDENHFHSGERSNLAWAQAQGKIFNPTYLTEFFLHSFLLLSSSEKKKKFTTPGTKLRSKLKIYFNQSNVTCFDELNGAFKLFSSFNTEAKF